MIKADKPLFSNNHVKRQDFFKKILWKKTHDDLKHGILHTLPQQHEEHFPQNDLIGEFTVA